MNTRKGRPKLSVVIITKNEEEKFPDCLKSVKWADEIVVIDSGSTDKTVEVAKKLGAKVVEQKSGGFSYRRNRGLKEAKSKWILYVDADERVTPQLKKEISELISNFQFPISKLSAYAIPRRNIILGKELKYGGWWPDYVKRLFLKEKLKGWKGDLHEEPIFEGEIGHLKNPLLHLKHDNLSDMVEKTNEWSEIEARLMFEANHPPMNILRFLSAGFREFWLRMVKQMAFLDGTEGIIYAMYQVYSRLISYAKLWEMQVEIKNSKLKIQN